MHYAEHTKASYASNIQFEDRQIEIPHQADFLEEFDLGVSYLVNDMDREAIDVFTRLINSEDDQANNMAFKLAAMCS